MWGTFFYNLASNYSLFNVVFWTSSGVSFLLDYFNVFQRINPIPKSKTLVKYSQYLSVVLFNTSIAVIPPLALLSAYEMFYEDTFTYPKMIFDILSGRIMVDIMFYGMHRLFHLHPLYNFFHKLHHTVIQPVGITAIYMTISDLYWGNVFPLYMPLLLLKTHPFTLKLWMGLTTATAIMVGHGGIKGLSDSHDLHHSLFSVNYGTDLFMDKIMGTSCS